MSRRPPPVFSFQDRIEESGTTVVVDNMRSAIAQLILVLALSCNLQANQYIKIKRSPLEVGFVTFAGPSLLKKVANRTLEVQVPQSPEMVVKPYPHYHHSHRWIPGYIKEHAYIPAHLDHFFIPVVTQDVEAVLVHPAIYNNYRSHYGGFGVGVDVGGQGLGHGFHVVFNF